MTGSLLLYPTPQTDEWLGSWLFRLAEANALSLPKLLEYLNLPPRERWKPSHFKRLEQVTGYSHLAALWTPEDQLRPQDNAFLQCGRIRVCPECLHADPVPYIRRQWLRNTYGACTTHQVRLESTCPHCQKHIQLIAPRLSAEGAAHQQYEHPDLRRCVQCGGDLSDRESQPFAVERVRPPRVVLQKPMFGNDWEEFEHAIRLISATYRLDIPLSPGIVRLSPPGQLPPTITQEDSEHLQKLIAWFLKNDGAFLTVHQRLRTTAAALIGLLDQQSGLPDQRQWMYTAWLLTRLRDDTSEQILMYWPSLVRFICQRFNQNPVESVTTEQAEAAIADFPVEFEQQEALISLLTGQVNHRALQSERPQGKVLQAMLADGQLHSFLNFVARQLTRTAPLLNQDHFIELTRHVHPDLHRDLLFKIGVKVKRGTGRRARKKQK